MLNGTSLSFSLGLDLAKIYQAAGRGWGQFMESGKSVLGWWQRHYLTYKQAGGPYFFSTLFPSKKKKRFAKKTKQICQENKNPPISKQCLPEKDFKTLKRP
jgi:hypothetical protein